MIEIELEKLAQAEQITKYHSIFMERFRSELLFALSLSCPETLIGYHERSRLKRCS